MRVLSYDGRWVNVARKDTIGFPNLTTEISLEVGRAGQARFYAPRIYEVERVAEREGFEPSVEILSLRRFSKPLPSATRPPLHVTINGLRRIHSGKCRQGGNHRRRGILPQLIGRVQERSAVLELYE